MDLGFIQYIDSCYAVLALCLYLVYRAFMHSKRSDKPSRKHRKK